MATRIITGIVSGNGTNQIVLQLDGNVVAGESGSLVFDGTNTIEDLAGNPLLPGSVAVTNNVAAPTGKSLNVTDSGIYATEQADLSNSDFTFGTWFKLTSLPSAVSQFLIYVGGTTVSLRKCVLFISTTGQIFTVIYSGNNQYIREVYEGPVSAGVWTHVAARFTNAGDVLEVFLNGSLVATTPTNVSFGGSPVSGGIVKIGVGDLNTAYGDADALIDQPFIIKSALTNQQISDVASKTLDPATLSPYVLLNFDNDTYADEGSYNGTFGGSSAFSADIP